MALDDEFNFSDVKWQDDMEGEVGDDEVSQALGMIATGDTSFMEVGFEPGEKAADAQDYEDISDDDLPEEEDAVNNVEVPALTDDNGTSGDIDELFGMDFGDHEGLDFPQDGPVDGHVKTPAERIVDDRPTIEELRRLNFNQDWTIPAPAESAEDLVKKLWPAFERGKALNWNELFPSKNAYFIPRAPAKPPKPLHPTKVSLDLVPDQEKAFRNSTGAATTSDKYRRIAEAESRGLVDCTQETPLAESDDEEFDYSTPALDEVIVKGVTWSDLLMVCHPWDIPFKTNPPQQADVEEDEPMDEWEKEFLGSSRTKTKKRKTTHDDEIDVIHRPRYPVPSFSNYEAMLVRIAKGPILDLNDPHLLLEFQEAPVKRQRIARGYKHTGGDLESRLSQRFNISNDEAYDALKENHQSRIRASLGITTVDHSLPALRMQWPYYRHDMDVHHLRFLHRPHMKFTKFMTSKITFNKLGTRKRKDIKGMAAQQVFARAKDLSLADHYSSATLLEYSEEYPIFISNFGMGNRIFNYYRKKDSIDVTRPVPEDKVGELQLLMPEDRSPFSNFGFVEPGESVRCIANPMCKAPIFKHETRNTDFLICRNTTGIEGTEWFIRNIDNVFVVGQQLPDDIVPKAAARRTTDVTKARLKRICYRLLKHSKDSTLKIGDVTKHFRDTDDVSNRQKMKEFLLYDKNDKLWRMKPGEEVPDSDEIRSLLKPEEAVMQDIVQSANVHLNDAGYKISDKEKLNKTKGAKDETEGMIDETQQPEALPFQLLPWEVTKNFVDAKNGKAMLVLHGDGDPTGCGLGISMIKTSMKGGYIGALQGPSATSEAAIAAERKANGGHKYNVKNQEELYSSAIHDIWEKQKANLSDPTEHEENESEREQERDDENHGVGQTPYSVATPAFDDSVSQFSMDNGSNNICRITRVVAHDDGTQEEVTVEITDPRIWRRYLKRRVDIDTADIE